MKLPALDTQPPTTYRAWAAHLAQTLDDLIDLVDAPRADSATQFHRESLRKFDHWHLEQQGQGSLFTRPEPEHRAGETV